jgi:hypothetical protein
VAGLAQAIITSPRLGEVGIGFAMPGEGAPPQRDSLQVSCGATPLALIAFAIRPRFRPHYDCLAPAAVRLDIWATEYIQVMESAADIVD